MISRYQNFLRRVLNSTLLRSSGIYTLSNFLNAAIPFLLLPFLTRKLSPIDYGIVAMFQLSVSILTPFIGLNIEGAISRKFYDKNSANFPSYIFNCLLIVVVSTFVASLILLIFKDYFFSITQLPIPWLKYVILVVASQFLVSVLLVNYQLKIKPIKYGLVQVSQTILNFSLTIFFIFILNKKWEGRLEGQILTSVSFALISFLILLKNGYLSFNFNKSYIKHALKFGVPLLPHAIGGMLFTAVDRFFLTKLVGLEQTGNYSVAYQLGAVISMLTVAFNNAYVPWLYENLNKKSLAIKIKIVKFTYLYFILIILGASLLLISFPYIISILIGGKFNSINTYTLFIVFGFVFQGMYFMVINYIFYAEKTHFQGIITVIVAILKLPITYFSIIWFGPIGASISFCLTFFLLFISTWFFSAKIFKMPWNLLTVKVRI